jgi:2,3-bisphosphoglycerate-independent phosphoglycerate mutase
VHVLTDGRDTDPYSGLGFIDDLEQFLQNKPAQIASICGRYYTMDRDKRWERVKKGYDLLVNGVGEKFVSAKDAIQYSYDKQITDEFIEPSVIVDNNNKPLALIKDNDVVICFNFRTDRLREITHVLHQQDMPELQMKALDLYYVTMTRYDEKFKNVHVMFDKDDVPQTLERSNF